eukprot:CAMPEP_0196593256 /NCGR_PEP_ID=MMETSP1081-20130531/75181_1 /TAXON_ID=36882 /ORGANISM="Pyramimonas amylifera, Strain CCMP720" /LENGTH=428 /DNA_ID=CAMNT_0041917189 /DNA_START=28 /DNA_END=1311 /DNA_ORIENTATION=+
MHPLDTEHFTSKSIRRVASSPMVFDDRINFETPSCSKNDSKDCNVSDVYAVVRPLRELGGPTIHKLPQYTKDLLRDLGICHYQTVIKSPDGSLTLFDFGPEPDKDTELSLSLFDIHTNGSKSQKSRSPSPKRGYIREEKIDSFDYAHNIFLIGRTNKTIDEIRAFNNQQTEAYKLRMNDCRHYVNRLCRYATGVDCASSLVVREFLQKRESRTSVHHWVRHKVTEMIEVPPNPSEPNRVPAHLTYRQRPRLWTNPIKECFNQLYNLPEKVIRRVAPVTAYSSLLMGKRTSSTPSLVKLLPASLSASLSTSSLPSNSVSLVTSRASFIGDAMLLTQTVGTGMKSTANATVKGIGNLTFMATRNSFEGVKMSLNAATAVVNHQVRYKQAQQMKNVNIKARQSSAIVQLKRRPSYMKLGLSGDPRQSQANW